MFVLIPLGCTNQAPLSAANAPGTQLEGTLMLPDLGIHAEGFQEEVVEGPKKQLSMMHHTV